MKAEKNFDETDMNKVVILPCASTLVTLTEAGITSLVKVLRKLERPAKTKPEDRRPTRKKRRKRWKYVNFTLLSTFVSLIFVICML